jgi:hypothetical protein
MLRWLGVALVALGCTLLALDGTRWDVLITSLPIGKGHGLHASEFAGLGMAIIGVAALWVGGKG